MPCLVIARESLLATKSSLLSSKGCSERTLRWNKSRPVRQASTRSLLVCDVSVVQRKQCLVTLIAAITVSCLNITALFSALGSAYVCDILGRRMSVRISAVIYFVSAFIQIFAPSLGILILGRSIQGAAIGMLSMTVPILLCEIAPGHARGLFSSIGYICLNTGVAVSAWV